MKSYITYTRGIIRLRKTLKLKICSLFSATLGFGPNRLIKVLLDEIGKCRKVMDKNYKTFSKHKVFEA